MRGAYNLDAPSSEIYTCSPSICKCQPAHQILTASLISFGDMDYGQGPRRPLMDTFLVEQIPTTATSVPNFNFLAGLVYEI